MGPQAHVLEEQEQEHCCSQVTIARQAPNGVRKVMIITLSARYGRAANLGREKSNVTHRYEYIVLTVLLHSDDREGSRASDPVEYSRPTSG
jgi:hypothetical protein